MNVIWIFGDQHRAQALSCNGDPNVNTPHIDRLSVDGANFERAVAGFPLCCPYRGSLVTSRYPHRCVPGHEHPLPRDARTVADAFNAEGYETAWFGKWHLGGWKERDGRAAFYTVPKEDRARFGTWIGYDNNNSQWDCWVHGHDATGEEVERYRLPGYETDCLSDLLIEYLDGQGKRKSAGEEVRFFAALSVQPPHNPYVAPPEFMARHNPQRLRMRPNVPKHPSIQDRARRELAGYYAMIENLDQNVGRIREALTNSGLAEDTYIIFFSDHGDLHGSHGQFLKLAPWEEATRVPFIISGGPSVYECRRGRPQFPVNHVDVAPTSLGLCGLPVPDWMSGHDYSAHFLKGKDAPTPPDSAYLQSVIPTGHGDSVDRPWRGIVTVDNWKYIALEHQPWLLFNLNDDPYEQVNLAHNSRYRHQRRRLQDRLAQWISDTGDAFPLPDL